MVVDPKALAPVKAEIKNLAIKVDALDKKITVEKTEEIIADASIFLKDWNRYIGRVEKVHIDRPEVKDIIREDYGIAPCPLFLFSSETKSKLHRKLP